LCRWPWHIGDRTACAMLFPNRAAECAELGLRLGNSFAAHGLEQRNDGLDLYVRGSVVRGRQIESATATKMVDQPPGRVPYYLEPAEPS